MRIRNQGLAVTFVALLFGLLPGYASGQGAAGGGPPGLSRAPSPVHGQNDRKARPERADENRSAKRHSHRPGPRGRGTRGVHVPKGHLPPRGLCRLWYPGRPPGHQPPPMSCHTALRQQRAAAIVVTHRGRIYRRHAPRWYRRPARDIVFRRRPRRDEGVSISVEILIDILGRTAVRRLETERRRLGLRGALTAQWISTNRSRERVLRVRAGGRPLAKLIDQNDDGRVEALYVRQDR